eukprot:6851366-Pyramimonas_sp.AAC.1
MGLERATRNGALVAEKHGALGSGSSCDRASTSMNEAGSDSAFASAWPHSFSRLFSLSHSAWIDACVSRCILMWFSGSNSSCFCCSAVFE